MESELLTTSRMARRLGVKSAWLRDEAEAGRVPAVSAGDTYLFSPDAVHRVLRGRAAGVSRYRAAIIPDADHVADCTVSFTDSSGNEQRGTIDGKPATVGAMGVEVIGPDGKPIIRAADLAGVKWSIRQGGEA